MILYDISSNNAKNLLFKAIAWHEANCIKKSKAGQELKSFIGKLKERLKVEVYSGNGEPKVGDIIYVPPNDYRVGGLAEIYDVLPSAFCEDMLIRVRQLPGTTFTWSYLKTQQSKLANQIGSIWSHIEKD